jgi:hypothetical protein
MKLAQFDRQPNRLRRQAFGETPFARVKARVK